MDCDDIWMDYDLSFGPESRHYFLVEPASALVWLSGTASCVDDNHVVIHHAKVEQRAVAEYVVAGPRN